MNTEGLSEEAKAFIQKYGEQKTHDLFHEFQEADTALNVELKPIQDLQMNQSVAQFGIDEATGAIDGGIGYTIGGATANALTPKLEQQAMKQGMTKLAPFLGRYVAPRILGAAAGTTMGPAGTAIGFVAPELAFQTAEMMSNSPRMPTEQMPQSPDRMSQIVQQNPQLEGTPDVFIKALQGPGVGYQPNALNAR